MLRNLSIRDFIIVDRLDLEFEPGFTVLTGETGAGKSILIDALALVLGARAEAIVVRQGAERAEISAQFDLDRAPAFSRWLSQQELAGDEGICLLRRVVDASGRSRAFINGTAATLAQLREAGEALVDIHGQHQHQSLLRASAQRELLDAFGGMHDLAARTAAAYEAWQRRRQQREAADKNSAAMLAEREELEWKVKELDGLAFTADGWEALQTEHSRLAHAVSLIEGAQYGLEALSEGDASSLARVNAVIARLNALREHDASLHEVLDVLEPAAIQMQEAVYSLRHYQHKLELDPQRLHEVERELDAIHSACRRYRIAPETLEAELERSRARLAELSAGSDPEALRRLEDAARAAFIGEARQLSTDRRRAASALSAEVTAAMQTLAMAGGEFEVVLETLVEPAVYGLEQVEFRCVSHSTMAPQALAKVASGGELSRLSLAIQTVTSRVAQVPTLVFDEVDAGIGGRVAEVVGTMLKKLGRRHQVMCITHLPQVAASADHQWQVLKTTTKTKVSSRVIALAPSQRVDEIARMLGGVKITDTTRKHAAEMLKLSEGVRD